MTRPSMRWVRFASGPWRGLPLVLVRRLDRAGYRTPAAVAAVADATLLRDVPFFGPAALRVLRAAIPYAPEAVACPHCGGSGLLEAAHRR